MVSELEKKPTRLRILYILQYLFEQSSDSKNKIKNTQQSLEGTEPSEIQHLISNGGWEPLL